MNTPGFVAPLAAVDFVYDEDVVFPTPVPATDPANPIPRKKVIGLQTPLNLLTRKLYYYQFFYTTGQGVLQATIRFFNGSTLVGAMPAGSHNFFGTNTNPYVPKSTPVPCCSGNSSAQNDAMTLFLWRVLDNAAVTGFAEPTQTPVVYPIEFQGTFDRVEVDVDHVQNVYSYRIWLGIMSYNRS